MILYINPFYNAPLSKYVIATVLSMWPIILSVVKKSGRVRGR